MSRAGSCCAKAARATRAVLLGMRHGDPARSDIAGSLGLDIPDADAVGPTIIPPQHDLQP